MESPSKSSPKPHRVRDFLPSVKPSYLSLILVLVCTMNLMRNESTNDRLLALEEQMEILSSSKSFDQNGSPSNRDKTSEKLISDSVILARKATKSLEKKPYFLKAESELKKPSTVVGVRNRRQASNISSITIEDVRNEISNQFQQLIPVKYCKSNEKVCPAGPPGIPGTKGTKGPRGRRGPKGTRGRTGTQGVMGPPGKNGKTGMTGPTGPRGEKGGMGAPGARGMPGPPGEPGESISVPRVMLSPANQTRDEGGNTNFYCTAGGNPRPRVEWKFNGSKLQSGSKHRIKNDGELNIKHLKYSDAGQYTCVATNILGSHQASGNLTVRDCDCWRSRRPESPHSGWGYSGNVDAIDFQTNGDVILRGYRLWGVKSGSVTFQVTIRLYRGSSMIAEKTGSYHTRSSVKTFEVYFSQQISIRAGLLYTATATITRTSAQSFYHEDGMTSASCTGVTVTFKSSSKDSNDSRVNRGQIPALIFRFSSC